MPYLSLEYGFWMVNTMKKVTIRDIAAAAGVSCATVSRSLADSSSISTATKEKVRRVSQEMGYSPNYVSLMPNCPSTGLVGMIVPNISRPDVAALIAQVESHLDELGLSLVLCSSRGDIQREKKCFQKLARLQADGVILLPAEAEPEVYLARQLELLPTVILWRNLQYATQSYVAPDWRRAAALCAEALERREIRKLLLLGEEGIVSDAQMTGAFQAACARKGIDLEICQAAENSPEAGKRQTAMCQAGTDPVAVMGFSRELAMGAKAALEDSRKDSCVICLGEGGSGMNALVFSPKEMADQACRILMDLIGSDIDGFSHRLIRPVLKMEEI